MIYSQEELDSVEIKLDRDGSLYETAIIIKLKNGEIKVFEFEDSL
ncbi:hypothetical protein ACU3L3_07065 [Priestia endophytica]